MKKLLILLCFLLLACGSDCDNGICESVNYELGPGPHEFTIKHQGFDRNYFVYVPIAYEFEPIPVVLNLHGRGGNAENHVQSVSLMHEDSDREGYIVVAPWGTRKDGDSKTKGLRFWNPGGIADPQNGHRLLDSIDDVGFIEKVLDDVEMRFNVDKKRIYSTGLSQGGMMSQYLGCEISDRIAAIASVSGPFATNPDKCSPLREIPVLFFHGTDDPITPYTGGKSDCSGIEYRGARESVEIWAGKNNCHLQSQIVYENGDVICERYCVDTEVIFCTIEGGGQTWPGGEIEVIDCDPGETINDIDATDYIWEFFSKHKLE